MQFVVGTEHGVRRGEWHDDQWRHHVLRLDSGGQERLSQWRETQRKREHEQAMTAQA